MWRERAQQSTMVKVSVWVGDVKPSAVLLCELELATSSHQLHCCVSLSWRRQAISCTVVTVDADALVTHTERGQLAVMLYNTTIYYYLHQLSSKYIRFYITSIYFTPVDCIVSHLLGGSSRCSSYWGKARFAAALRRQRPAYSDTTQLNSTSSCRHVHSVNNCHRSVLNVVTQWGCL